MLDRQVDLGQLVLRGLVGWLVGWLFPWLVALLDRQVDLGQLVLRAVCVEVGWKY